MTNAKISDSAKRINKMKIAESFQTSGGHIVEVTGQLLEHHYDGDGYVKIEFDFIVKGHGSQGGVVTRTQFSKNGTDYVAMVGQLAITQNQMNLIDKMRSKLTEAKNNHPLTLSQNEYGTFEEVERKHSWMKGTY